MATAEELAALRTELENFKTETAATHDSEKQAQDQVIADLRASLEAAQRDVRQATTLAAASIEAAPIQRALEALQSRQTALADKKLLVETGAGQHALMQLIVNTQPQDALYLELKDLLLHSSNRLILKDPTSKDLHDFYQRETATTLTKEEIFQNKKVAMMSLSLLKKFSVKETDTWDDFFSDFRRITEGVGFTDVELKTHFLNCIAEDARRLYSGNEPDLRRTSFQNLVDFYEKEFSNKASIKSLFQLSGLAQLSGESVALFASRMKVVTKRFYIIDAPIRRVEHNGVMRVIPNPLQSEEAFANEAVRCLLDRIHSYNFLLGVRPEIRKRFKKISHLTFEEMVAEAKDHEECIALLGPEAMSNHLSKIHMRGREDIDESSEGDVHYVNRRSRSPGSRNQQKPRSNSKGDQGARPKEGCWVCGDHGHMRSECPRYRHSPASSQQRYNKSPSRSQSPRAKVRFSGSKQVYATGSRKDGSKSSSSRKDRMKKVSKKMVNMLLSEFESRESSSCSETETDTSFESTEQSESESDGAKN